MKLSIIIPVYNEEATIGSIINIIKGLKLSLNIKKEIIIIDDGSTDSTFHILKNEKNSYIKIFKHEKNLGKGAALRTGFKNVTGDIILIQDADLEYNPNDYNKLLTPILEKKAKIVFGTRLKNYSLKFWGEGKTVLPTHLIANRFLTMLTNILYLSNLTDMETCYKVFKKEVINKVDLKCNRFDFEPEFTAKVLKNGFKIVEIPIKTNPRSYIDGKKIGFVDGLMAIYTLFKYRFTN